MLSIIEGVEVCTERVEACVPQLLERAGPALDRLERCALEVVDALPGDGLDRHDPRIPKHPKVLAHLRLPDVERLGDLADGSWPGAQ